MDSDQLEGATWQQVVWSAMLVGLAVYAWYTQPSLHSPTMNVIWAGGTIVIGIQAWKLMEVDDGAD